MCLRDMNIVYTVCEVVMQYEETSALNNAAVISQGQSLQGKGLCRGHSGTVV